MTLANAVVTFAYTDHRGETSVRRVIPVSIRHGTMEPWHHDEQWLLEAFDLDRRAMRTFAMRNIVDWSEEC